MLFRNTMAQSASVIAGYLFSFLLAPLMISRLGLDAFGVWAVTGAFATYAGLLDLGIGRSLARFIAVYDAADEKHRIDECVGLGLLATVVVGVATAAVAVLVAPFASDQLGVLDSGEMRLVLLSSVAIWTLNGIDGVLTAVGIGLRRMVPPNVATTVGATINFAFSVAALLLSSSLVVYALANAAAGVFALIPAAIAMRYVWRSPYVAWPTRELVKDVLGFSIKNQVGWFADLINFQTDKVIIALMVDIRAAAVYEIASRVVLAVRSVAVLTVSAMIPTAAARIVEEGRTVIEEMYRRYTLRTCAIAFPLFTVTSVTAPFLLIAWLKTAPGDAELLVPFLTLAYFVNITTAVGSTIAIGAGHPGMASANSVLIAVVNVVLTLALAPIFGLWGVVAGTFLAVTFGSLLFNVRFLRLFGLQLRDLLAAVLPAGVLALGLGIPPAIIALLVGVPSGRPSATFWLLISAAIYVIPYWLIATRRGYLPSQLEFRPFRRPDSIGAAS
ncbi:MAG: oligosaccharide flippase family protein [Thermoleophilia bacterium]|nr:oligosaccharide flippase family protein [Thermoleophilia bacterium]